MDVFDSMFEVCCSECSTFRHNHNIHHTNGICSHLAGLTDTQWFCKQAMEHLQYQNQITCCMKSKRQNASVKLASLIVCARLTHICV